MLERDGGPIDDKLYHWIKRKGV